MKCPKCHYISFDEVERCRNCGYDFTLSRTERPVAELPLRQEGPSEGPAGDFPLAAQATSAPAPLDRRAGARERRASPADALGVDLPLFDAPVPGVDDTPLLTAPAPPRAPLSVRRSAIDPPRPTPATPAPIGGAGARRAAQLDLPPSAPGPPVDKVADRTGAGERADGDPIESIGLRRVLAAAIDLVLLGAIDLAVLNLTLQMTGLDMARLSSLPLVPFVAFLTVLNGGYFVGFTTASGQTIGKMITGIRVIGRHSTRVPLGNAIVRAASSLVTVFSLGIGYLPALAARDPRALHDRMAGTLVVRR